MLTIPVPKSKKIVRVTKKDGYFTCALTQECDYRPNGQVLELKTYKTLKSCYKFAASKGN